MNYVPPVLLTILSAGCFSRPTPPDCTEESPPAFWRSEPQQSLVPPGIRTFCKSKEEHDGVKWFSRAPGNKTIATVVDHLEKNTALVLAETIRPFKEEDFKELGTAIKRWSYDHRNGGKVMVSVFEVKGTSLETPHSYVILQYRLPTPRTTR